MRNQKGVMQKQSIRRAKLNDNDLTEHPLSIIHEKIDLPTFKGISFFNIESSIYFEAYNILSYAVLDTTLRIPFKIISRELEATLAYPTKSMTASLIMDSNKNIVAEDHQSDNDAQLNLNFK